MPIYEFQCENCGYKNDKMVSVSKRDNPQTCPKCLCLMQRQISNPGFKFVGKGFYTNDYKIPQDARKQALKEKKARKEGKSGYTEI